jgi:hypothetical protein
MSEEIPPLMESLEDRCLLSAAPMHAAMAHSHNAGHAAVVVNHAAAMGANAHGGGHGAMDVQVAHGSQAFGQNCQADSDIDGSVTAVDTINGTITISSVVKGATVETTYNVAKTATITIDGAAGTLDQLVAGVAVRLVADPADATTLTSIVAVGKQAAGDVTTVDTTAGTLTLAGERGEAPVVYTIDPKVPIIVNGKAGTLADIAVGTDAVVQFSALDGTTIIGVTVHDEGGQGHGSPGGGVGVHHGVAGTVDSVDPTAGTITVSTTHKGTTVQKTLKVSPTATMLINGKTVTLDVIPTGIRVALKLDRTHPTLVTSIIAINARTHGAVTAIDTTNNTITLAGKNGATPVTYPLNADTVITVNGAVATLADIVVGSAATITFSALDGTTVISVKA